MLNPISFRPCPVTFWTTLVYLALLIPIIIINETVPSAPSEYHGVNLTAAWLDLATLTKHYHPYNSRYNDEVHSWLLLRTQQILDSNGVSWTTEQPGAGSVYDPTSAFPAPWTDSWHSALGKMSMSPCLTTR